LLAYPGTGASLYRVGSAQRFTLISDESLDFIADVYQRSQNQISVPSGPGQVLFMPGAMFTLTWRLIVGTSGRSVLRKESPLAGRLGQTIAHPTLSFVDDPWNVGFPGARAFDDEGTPTKPLSLIENGVLKSFFYDRLYAKKANQPPTGHGYKCAGGFSGNDLATPPQPSLQHPTIKPGKSSFADLVKMMDHGVIVFGPLGPHSGNIPNGDFSLASRLAWSSKRGKSSVAPKTPWLPAMSTRRSKNVIGIGSLVEHENMGNYPPVLFDGVSISG